MIPWYLIIYTVSGLLYTITIILLARHIQKEDDSLPNIFFLLALLFFLISLILNSFQSYYDIPITQGIALIIGMTFLFSKILLQFHSKK